KTPSTSAAHRLTTSCALAAVVSLATLGATGCTVFVNLPTTPRLQELNEQQVFSMAPPPDWSAPQGDTAAAAAVDINCGIGPRTATGGLSGAISVKGRPGSAAVGPLNVSIVLDRSGSMAGDPFRNMLIA